MLAEPFVPDWVRSRTLPSPLWFVVAVFHSAARTGEAIRRASALTVAIERCFITDPLWLVFEPRTGRLLLPVINRFGRFAGCVELLLTRR